MRPAFLSGVLVWGACATEPSENPTPVLASVTPSTLPLVSDSATITLAGSGFVWNSLVEWDTIGLPVEAEFISSTELRGRVGRGHTNDGGTHYVRVRNLAPGGGLSAPVPIVVTFPVPRIDSIVPDSVLAGSRGWSGSIWGRDFALADSKLEADGVTMPWFRATRTRFDAQLDSAMVVTPRAIVISVTNPPPGGGTATGILRVVSAPPNP